MYKCLFNGKLNLFHQCKISLLILFLGPMDNTVCDFWRMIWEQHLELILMLTNLEEYSKTKCAKYWADKSEGEKTFGDISIHHVHEKRYSGLWKFILC